MHSILSFVYRELPCGPSRLQQSRCAEAPALHFVHYVCDHEHEICVQLHPVPCEMAPVAGSATSISWVTSVVSDDKSLFGQGWQVYQLCPFCCHGHTVIGNAASTVIYTAPYLFASAFAPMLVFYGSCHASRGCLHACLVTRRSWTWTPMLLASSQPEVSFLTRALRCSPVPVCPLLNVALLVATGLLLFSNTCWCGFSTRVDDSLPLSTSVVTGLFVFGNTFPVCVCKPWYSTWVFREVDGLSCPRPSPSGRSAGSCPHLAETAGPRPEPLEWDESSPAPAQQGVSVPSHNQLLDERSTKFCTAEITPHDRHTIFMI